MTWKGLHPVVHLLETTHEKGVRIAPKAFQSIAQHPRDDALPQYSVRIRPVTAIG